MFFDYTIFDNRYVARPHDFFEYITIIGALTFYTDVTVESWANLIESVS